MRRCGMETCKNVAVRHDGNDQLQNRGRVFAFNLPDELTRYLRRANPPPPPTCTVVVVLVVRNGNESTVSEI